MPTEITGCWMSVRQARLGWRINLWNIWLPGVYEPEQGYWITPETNQLLRLTTETAVDDYIYSVILLTEATGHSISRLLRTQGNLGGPLPVCSSEGSEVSYRTTPLGWLPFISFPFWDKNTHPLCRGPHRRNYPHVKPLQICLRPWTFFPPFFPFFSPFFLFLTALCVYRTSLNKRTLRLSLLTRGYRQWGEIWFTVAVG